MACTIDLIYSIYFFVLFVFFFLYCVGTHFRRLIPEEGTASQNPAAVKRIIFCTGKVYYDLTKQRKNKEMEDTVAIVRIEQVLHVWLQKAELTVWEIEVLHL